MTMLSFFGIVYAQGINNPVLDPSVGSGEGGPIVGKIISAIVGLFIIFAFVLALFHLLFGAYRWITSSGDKQRLQQAQESMTQAIMGLILVAAVWAIMTLLSQFLGLGTFPSFNLPTITGTI